MAPPLRLSIVQKCPFSASQASLQQHKRFSGATDFIAVQTVIESFRQVWAPTAIELWRIRGRCMRGCV